MNIPLQRTLVVCALAAALALALALATSGNASAAPPEPVNDEFTVEGFCDFPVDITGTGKSKLIELPGGRFIGVNPGLCTTLTNAEVPTHQVSYVITGAAHITELPSGELLVVLTGRNVQFDPELGIVLAIGRFTYVFDPETGDSTPLRGKGRIVDVCQRLA